MWPYIYEVFVYIVHGSADHDILYSSVAMIANHLLAENSMNAMASSSNHPLA